METEKWPNTGRAEDKASCKKRRGKIDGRNKDIWKYPLKSEVSISVELFDSSLKLLLMQS